MSFLQGTRIFMSTYKKFLATSDYSVMLVRGRAELGQSPVIAPFICTLF